jgi:ribonuclease D
VEDYQYIDTQVQWNEALDHCKKSKLLAVDTEFIRRDTFFPQAALVQLATTERCFLLDPLAINDLSGLAELLTNLDITKVLHACSEDLEVFQHLLGVVPKPVFDTQIAAGYLGLRFSMGYQALVQEVLGIEIDKVETMSNWLQRPLTPRQKEYAAQDTLYLPEIYIRLQKQLLETDRLHWLQEDCIGMVSASERGNNPDYKKIKMAWKLTPKSLALLRELVDWRDNEAKARNKPRSWIVSDKLLIEVAANLPGSRQALHALKETNSNVISRYGAKLVELTADIEQIELAHYPAQIPGPLDVTQTKQIKLMKSTVRNWASEWEVAPEQLLRGKEYEAIQRWLKNNREELPVTLTGWRFKHLIEPLLAAIK